MQNCQSQIRTETTVQYTLLYWFILIGVFFDEPVTRFRKPFNGLFKFNPGVQFTTASDDLKRNEVSIFIAIGIIDCTYGNTLKEKYSKCTSCPKHPWEDLSIQYQVNINNNKETIYY